MMRLFFCSKTSIIHIQFICFWAFERAIRCIFFVKKTKKDAATIPNAKIKWCKLRGKL